MKKFLIMAVMVIMTFTLTACGTNNGTDNADSNGRVGDGNTNNDSMIGNQDGTGTGAGTGTGTGTDTDSANRANGDYYFNATVIEVSGDKLKVKPENNENNQNADEKLIGSDSIEVDAGILTTLGLTDIKEGDKVRVVYDKDTINDDYSKIDTVYTVYRIDDKGDIVTGE